MIWLLLLILAILVFGVFGAIKLAFWVLLLAGAGRRRGRLPRPRAVHRYSLVI